MPNPGTRRNPVPVPDPGPSPDPGPNPDPTPRPQFLPRGFQWSPVSALRDIDRPRLGDVERGLVHKMRRCWVASAHDTGGSCLLCRGRTALALALALTLALMLTIKI